MFETTRFYYPNGNEEESMRTTYKQFDTFEKALRYCQRYSRGLRFAGVKIEDENGNTIYEITSDCEDFDYR